MIVKNNLIVAFRISFSNHFVYCNYFRQPCPTKYKQTCKIGKLTLYTSHVSILHYLFRPNPKCPTYHSTGPLKHHHKLVMEGVKRIILK